ncbi:hypothetical protein M2454_002209 [Aequitasia blattaphilus]|uniref:Cyclophilin-like fold protein n=1 Tax=Aequitasia blattaphilus TaxID=2949332 RepID=A0ABT1EAW8_9FIRM|nr:cyclophilin-like fold protein [Aequitasia blattaphilus]MCP1102980.1 cyclophilin-like fold protein [Aequitasia blattaphilus]MCR8615620.1 cyclophilin-like fold protein [Aequitasia blattaphilus]
MKRRYQVIILLIMVLGLMGCGIRKETVQDTPEESKEVSKDHQDKKEIRIIIDEVAFQAEFYDNDSVKALINEMPFTLNMEDFSHQEKVASIPFDLPKTQTERPDMIQAGEIYIWSGNSLVLFYTTFQNSYGGYVPIGRILDTDTLTDALGSGNAEVLFEVK